MKWEIWKIYENYSVMTIRKMEIFEDEICSSKKKKMTLKPFSERIMSVFFYVSNEAEI